MSDKPDDKPQSHEVIKAQTLINELRGRIATIGNNIYIMQRQLKYENYGGIEHRLQVISWNYNYICNLLNDYQQQDKTSE